MLWCGVQACQSGISRDIWQHEPSNCKTRRRYNRERTFRNLGTPSLFPETSTSVQAAASPCRPGPNRRTSHNFWTTYGLQRGNRFFKSDFFDDRRANAFFDRTSKEHRNEQYPSTSPSRILATSTTAKASGPVSLDRQTRAGFGATGNTCVAGTFCGMRLENRLRKRWRRTSARA